jgi:chromosome segregation protein
MYLKSLEINGFKSFAKKGFLEFSVPIVAIVGPNGSGKSNVAEAFRFVLGEQSMKSMRGKRGEDLIWNGSKTTPKMNRAGVKLVFDNRSKIFNLDFDEVSIERAVHRDGVNEYLLNGTQVRLRDVLELLAQANIGASGHHIISQGEADRILTASIKERKGMVEDALGLKVYQYKREESVKKLEKTAENIKQVESLRREIAPHIKFLEKQIEKIHKAESLRDELFKLYQEYLSREEKYLFDTKQKLQKERHDPDLELREIERKVIEARDLIKETESNDKGAHELLNLEGEMQRAERHESEVRSNLSRIEGELAAQERILRKSENHSVSNFSATVTLSEIERFKDEISVSALAAENNDNPAFLRSVISRIITSLSNFIEEQRNKSQSSKDNDDIKDEIERLKNAQHQEAIELDSAGAKVRKLREEYQIFRAKREEENIRGREAERDLFALMNRRTELSQILYNIQNKLENLDREEASFKNELQEAQALVGHEVLRFAPALNENEDRVAQEDRKKRLEKMKIRLEEAGAAGGAEIKKEFEEVTSRDQYLSREIEDLQKSAETLKTLIADLDLQLDIQFKDGILKINKAFAEYFVLMFGGGSASLEVIKEQKRKKKSDSEFILDENDSPDEDDDVGEEGIEVAVSLPNKRVKGLSMLSGGERALTSIALLFAISQVNPPPFIILDETDAALDEANSRKYGDMVENLAKHSQLIVITHNRETMSRAGILYGITMGADGYSKLLSVKFDEAVAVAK